GATSYNVYRATTSNGQGATPYRTGVTGPGFTDTGVTAGTTYFYRVSAVNTAGESARSSEVSATPTAPSLPAPPANPNASAGPNLVALEWAASAGATSYNVYLGTASGGEGSTPYRTGIPGTSFSDTGLTAGTTYFYQVTAVNGVGESARSAEVSATPLAA